MTFLDRFQDYPRETRPLLTTKTEVELKYAICLKVMNKTLASFSIVYTYGPCI